MESNTTVRPMEEATLLKITIGNSSMAILDENITAFYWLTLCISIPGCIVNGVVVWIVGFKIKKNPFSIYILNLAIADFSFLSCVFCWSIFSMAENESFTMSTYLTMDFTQLIMLFGYNTGLYLLTAISVERCLAVLFPIWYKCRRSRHQSSIVCVLLWILAFLVIPMESLFDTSPVVFFTINLVHCAVFIPLMVFSGVFLVAKLQKTSVKSPSSRLYMVIVSSIFLFIFLAMPIRLFMTFQVIVSSSVIESLYPICIFLSSLNSSINSLVYFFVGSRKKERFRESMKVILSRAIQGEGSAAPCTLGTTA